VVLDERRQPLRGALRVQARADADDREAAQDRLHARVEVVLGEVDADAHADFSASSKSTTQRSPGSTIPSRDAGSPAGS